MFHGADHVQFFFSVASLRRNVGLISLFFCLSITFMLLAISKSYHHSCYPPLSDRDIPELQASSSTVSQLARQEAEWASSLPS